MPRFLKQEEITQYAVKNSCPDICWNLYGFPMPAVEFKFEGKEIEMGDKYSFNYGRNGEIIFFFSNKEMQYKSQLHSTGLKIFLYFTLGIVKLQINTFCAADVGTYECVAKNDYGEMTQPIIVVMAQYPEFIKSPNEVNLIGVNGGKVECEIFGVPKPKVTWFKDYHPLKETFRVQAYHYPPQVNIIVYISLLDNATNYT